MNIKRFSLLTILTASLLAACNGPVPIGDGIYRDKTGGDEEADSCMEVTWDFTSLEIFGDISTSFLKNKFINYCNSNQSDNVVKDISTKNVIVGDISPEMNKITTRLIVGNNDMGNIEFSFYKNVKYVKVDVSSYYEISRDNEEVNINENSALYVNNSVNHVSLSVSENKVAQTRRKFIFEDTVNKINFYTTSMEEKVIINSITIGYIDE